MSSTSETSNLENASEKVAFDAKQSVPLANVYFLVAKAFSSPLYMDESYPSQLLEVIPELPEGLYADAQALAEAWMTALTEPKQLSLAYAHLFLGPFEILTPPYASFYLEADQRLMGQVSQHVARTYVEAGLEPGPGPQEAPDHVVLEWEFMYFLSYQLLNTGESRWASDRRAFYRGQMLTWMPTLADGVLKASEHPFYDALARFLLSLMKSDVMD